MDILNKKANHKSGSRRSVFLTGLLALALLLPISTASLWTDASSQTKEKSKEMKAKEHAEKQAKWDAMSDAEKEDYEATENAEWDALSDEEKEARKAEKKAEWDAMSAEDKSAWMWDKVCYADNSAACVVGKTMKAHGVEAGLTEYASLKAAEEGKYAFKEKAFNNLGYAFLYVEKIDAAIAVLKINNDAFPDSWNTYDSLAEVYTLANQYKKAIKLYEVAVKMNPEGEHSKAQLDKLLTMVAEN